MPSNNQRIEELKENIEKLQADIKKLQGEQTLISRIWRWMNSFGLGAAIPVALGVVFFSSPIYNQLQKAQDRVNELSGNIQSTDNEEKMIASRVNDAKGKLDSLEPIITGFNDNRPTLTEMLKATTRPEIRTLLYSVNTLTQMPVGSIAIWPVAQPPSDGKWMICDGRPVVQQDIPDYCNLVKDTYLASEGGTIIRLPDLRGVFVRGLDTRDGRTSADPESPRAIGSIQNVKLPDLYPPDISDLRVAAGLEATNPHQILYLNSGNRKDDLRKFGTDFRTFWGPAAGEKNTVQLHGGDTTVETIGLLGTIGSPTWKSGESRPVNVAMNFIIRVKP